MSERMADAKKIISGDDGSLGMICDETVHYEQIKLSGDFLLLC